MSKRTQTEYEREYIHFLEEVVAGVMSRMRPEIVQRLSDSLALVRGAASTIEDESAEWLEIGSLSQLRAEVGGRFQNIKKKWISAGFPLKEHKGDTGADYELVEEGWQDLSNWVSKQGYEIRKSRKKDVYFEIRN